jgi:hypothetical protein
MHIPRRVAGREDDRRYRLDSYLRANEVFPHPVAFYKIIGLTRLFPHSRIFGRYHLGHLPENEAAPIEILSGACMFLRKRTLTK